jgi:MscS family membrane protein
MIDFINNLFREYSWIPEIGIVVFSSIVLNYTHYRFNRKLRKKLLSGGHFILNAVVESIYWPALLFLWLNTIFFVLDNFPIIEYTLYTAVHKFLTKVRLISNITLMGWFFMKFIKNFEQLLLQGSVKSRFQDQTTIHAVSKISRVLATLIIMMCAFPVFGMPVSGLVALGGGSALILGIAAQQVFANYLGGLIIYSDRHFKVGDWVYSPDKNIEGIIESINWRTTSIRTFEKRALYVPNSIFSSITLVNATRMTHWPIKEVIPLRYQDIESLEPIANDIELMLSKRKEIDNSQTIISCLEKFSPYSIDLLVIANTKITTKTEYRQFLHKLLLEIYKIIKSHGAEIAIPKQVIELNDFSTSLSK